MSLVEKCRKEAEAKTRKKLPFDDDVLLYLLKVAPVSEPQETLDLLSDFCPDWNLEARARLTSILRDCGAPPDEAVNAGGISFSATSEPSFGPGVPSQRSPEENEMADRMLAQILQEQDDEEAEAAFNQVQLDAREQELLGADDKTILPAERNFDSSADGGHFSLQVLELALARFGLELFPAAHPKARPLMTDPSTATEAFVCQCRDHWFAVRKLGACWWNLNSTQARPVQVTPERLATSLDQVERDGSFAFLVRGALPALSKPSESDQNFHNIFELLQPAADAFANAWTGGACRDSWCGPAEAECRSTAVATTSHAGRPPDMLREMGFTDTQCRAALTLSHGSSEGALQLLLSSSIGEDLVCDPPAFAREVSVAILSLERADAKAEDALRLVSLLSSRKPLLEAAAAYVDFSVLTKFLVALPDECNEAQCWSPALRSVIAMAIEQLLEAPQAAPDPCNTVLKGVGSGRPSGISVSAFQ